MLVTYGKDRTDRVIYLAIKLIACLNLFCEKGQLIKLSVEKWIFITYNFVLCTASVCVDDEYMCLHILFK